MDYRAYLRDGQAVCKELKGGFNNRLPKINFLIFLIDSCKDGITKYIPLIAAGIKIIGDNPYHNLNRPLLVIQMNN